MLYVVIPLATGYITRKMLDGSGDHERIISFIEMIKPISIMGLLVTVVLLFGFQIQAILDKQLVIGLIPIPLLVQSYEFSLLMAGRICGLRPITLGQLQRSSVRLTYLNWP